MGLRRRVLIWLAAPALWAASAVAQAQSIEDLQRMSISELADIDVSSVTKTAETLGNAPGAIHVITHDDIVRMGATTLPEILRLAPNLHVAQTSASDYVITARGFSGNQSAQNFSNKLLVLIDGRSVYTPLYSGVYWDMQDVLAQDIERIEVISGPGATLWGANAVNGVINVITRKAEDTQGGLLHVVEGDQERALSLRYGGRAGETLTYRLYAKALSERDTIDAAGARVDDDWRRVQGGFRVDWAASEKDLVTVQGDAYTGAQAQRLAPDEDIRGRNLLARWNRSSAGRADLQVQAFYDWTERDAQGAGFEFRTYDLELQHSFLLGERQQIVWGAGARVSRYRIVGNEALQFSPARRTLKLFNLFVQDSFSLTDSAKLIVGMKLEDDPYSGATLLPSVRASWKPSASTLLWGAVSRAIRSPTPFDRDVVEKLGALVFLTGGADFRSEKLTAYEFGARIRPSGRASLSISAFYNTYDDLRSIEITPVTMLPLQWGNGMRGDAYGVEAWGDFRVTPWWRLSAGYAFLDKKLEFKPGSSGLVGLSQAGDDPKHRASLRSFMDLGEDVTLDAALRYVDVLPEPKIPSYVELNARLAWNITDRAQLSVAGFNLLHKRHQEFPAPEAYAVPRSAAVGLQWRF